MELLIGVGVVIVVLIQVAGVLDLSGVFKARKGHRTNAKVP